MTTWFIAIGAIVVLVIIVLLISCIKMAGISDAAMEKSIARKNKKQ